MSIKWLCCWIFCIYSLASCIRTYQSPTQGPKAYLAQDSPSALSVAIYKDAIHCKNAMPLLPIQTLNYHSPISIRANHLTTIRVITHSVTQTQFFNLSFIPKAGAYYRVKALQNPQNIAIFETSENNDSFLYNPVRTISRHTGPLASCDDIQLQEALLLISP